MVTNILDTEYGRIKYYIFDNYIKISEYSGRDLEVIIPENIEGKPVTVIGKKAFLSQKLVKTIILPRCTQAIEDYAFARCSKLNRLVLPYKKLNLGSDILKDCKSLTFIENANNCEDKNNSDIAFLLATTLKELDAFFLFDFESAGSKEWFSHLDATINMRMDKDDMEDFSKMILCGEEEVVCGEDGTIEDSNPEHYKSNRVKEKIRIALMRLMHDYMLDENLRDKLTVYLLDHTKGMKTEETWQVVLNEHGDEQQYYDFLLKIGAINSNNLQEVLGDMGERHAQIKSYLIINGDKNKKTVDAFSDFAL